MSIIQSSKVIFHIDMNMFFCSVAVIKNPSLKGKAFVCGRTDSIKGVVATASYEARKYGIHSAMPLIEAIQKKKDLIVVSSDFEMIKYYHNKFIKLIKEYSKKIEVASIDEVYVDMTELCKYRNGLELAKEIQVRLVKEYHLPASIGIAPTLFLAKMASDMKKPLGIVVIRRRDSVEKLKYLSVKDIHGIGKKTYPKLIENNILTIGDLINIDNKEKIVSLIGQRLYDYTINSINGKTTDIIDENRHSVKESISNMVTFDNYLTNEADLLLELRKLTRKLITRINDKDYMTKTIGITLRDESFRTFTRSKTIEYTNDFYDINDVINDLIYENYNEGVHIRLIGINFSNLKKREEVLKEDYNLFTYESFIEKKEKIKRMLSDMQDKYGVNSIYLGIKK